MKKEKVIVFTGAGVSAESGLKTFRASDGLWEDHSIYDVATPDAWARNPELVLKFYNERRAQAFAAEPNAAHLAVAKLEEKFDVTVITQNVDNLHERAGSSHVLHLHGELTKVRSTANPELVYDIGSKPTHLGDLCDEGGQLRPHIVWFGEAVPDLYEAAAYIEKADKVLVIGTSLSVQPAAGLLGYAPEHAEKFIVALDVQEAPYGYTMFSETAGKKVPEICEEWLSNA